MAKTPNKPQEEVLELSSKPAPQAPEEQNTPAAPAPDSAANPLPPETPPPAEASTSGAEQGQGEGITPQGELSADEVAALTPADVLELTAEDLDKIAEAKTPEEVDKVILDAKERYESDPEAQARMAEEIALAQQANVVENKELDWQERDHYAWLLSVESQRTLSDFGKANLEKYKARMPVGQLDENMNQRVAWYLELFKDPIALKNKELAFGDLDPATDAPESRVNGFKPWAGRCAGCTGNPGCWDYTFVEGQRFKVSNCQLEQGK